MSFYFSMEFSYYALKVTTEQKLQKIVRESNNSYL